MNDKLSHLEKAAKEIRLTSAERSHIKMRLAEEVRARPLPLRGPVPSPHQRFFASPIFIALAVFLMVGSSTAFAATRALPGDPLYALKTDVFEPAEAAFQVSPTARASWQVHLASLRLQEAGRLAYAGRLTPATQATLAAKVAISTADAARAVTALEAVDPEGAQTVAVDLDATLLGNAAPLATLALSEDRTAAPVLAAALSSATSNESVSAADADLGAGTSGATQAEPPTVVSEPALPADTGPSRSGDAAPGITARPHPLTFGATLAPSADDATGSPIAEPGESVSVTGAAGVRILSVPAGSPEGYGNGSEIVPFAASTSANAKLSGGRARGSAMTKNAQLHATTTAGADFNTALDLFSRVHAIARGE